jgi:flavin-dependent dehydrogenase
MARAGLSVVLVERGAPGRDKPCGDIFMPSAVHVLERLGFDQPKLAALGGVQFDRIDILGERECLWKVGYAKDPVWMIPRRVIDQALRDSLPPTVRLFYEATVTEIAPRRDKDMQVNAKYSFGHPLAFQCQGVILAGGAQDPLATRWGVAGARLVAPSISAYTRNPDLARPVFEFRDSCRPGYRWLFPTCSGQANVGICSLVKRPGSSLKALGHELLQSYHLPENAQWRGGVGGLWSGNGECWHHPSGFVVCGDAAGLVDPVNGEGLTAALLSGEAAGAAMADFILRLRDPGILRRYSRWVKSTFTARYAPSPLRAAWHTLAG